MSPGPAVPLIRLPRGRGPPSVLGDLDVLLGRVNPLLLVTSDEFPYMLVHCLLLLGS